MPRGPRLFLGVVLVIALTTLSMALPVKARETSGIYASAGGSVKLWSEYTSIYGLEKLYVGIKGGLTAASIDPASGLAVIGGDGYVAALDLENRKILWVSGVEGIVTHITLDSEGSPSYAAVATSEGEVAVYSLPQGGLLAKYYTGHDDQIVNVVITDSADGAKLVVLTAKGYLKVYRIGSPYWAEIGPDPGEEALRSIGGLKVVEAIPVITLKGWDSWIFSSDVVIRYEIVNSSARAGLQISVYYKEGSQASPAYEFKDKPLAGNPYMTVTATLRLWLMVEPYGVVESLSGTEYPLEANFTGLIKGLYPGLYRVMATYHYVIVNKNTSEVVTDKCYTGLSQPLELVPGANLSLKMTLSEGGVCNPVIGQAPLVPVMILDTTNLPEGLSTSSPRYRLVLGLKGGSPSSMEVVATKVPPPGDLGSRGVRGLLFLNYASLGRVLLEYLNSDMEPISPSGEYAEELAFRASPSALAVAPDLSSLYIGTSAGTLYKLDWLDSEGRYVASASIEATGDESVGYVMPRPWNVVVAIGVGGLAQAVNETDWKPLWTGGPGYPYLQLPLGGAAVLGAWSGPRLPLVVAPEVGVGYPYLLVASGGHWSTPPLSRVTVNASVVLETLHGVKHGDLGEESYVEALSGSEVVARALFEGGIATLYLPPGSYKLRINATNWGLAERALEVGKGDVPVKWTLILREVRLTAYTPPGPPPGYSLVSGPVAGVNVTLQPTGYSGNLTYKPLATAVSGITGPDGSLSLLLWAGVSYRASLEKPGFIRVSYEVKAWGTVNETLEIYPQLYNVTFKALDNEAVEEGLFYLARNATIKVVLGGRSITLSAPNGTVIAGLPEGNYTVIVEAPAYKPYTGRFSVPANTTVVALLQALYYPVKVVVNMQDDLTGLASGPLGGATVNVTLVDPPIKGVGGVAFTDKQGTAVFMLRAGLYRITISHPYAQVYVGSFYFNGTGRLVINVRPRYANVTIDLYDAELYSAGVKANNATVTLTYEGVLGGGGLQLEAPKGVLKVLLPYGPYAIYARAPSYEDYGPQTIVIARANQSVPIYMTPVKYPVLVRVIVKDPLWHLAEGPASGALLSFRLVKPKLPLPPITGYTGSDGAAELLLRSGVYTLTISYPYTGNITYTLAVGGAMSTTITVTPAYTNATINVVDVETGKPVPNVTLALYYSGVGKGGSVEVTLENGKLTLTLPPGTYKLVASERHYHASETSLTIYQGEPVNLTLELNPVMVRVSFRLTATPVNASVPLPPRPLEGADIILVPVDPILKAVGAGEVEIRSGSDGVATAYVRVGTYSYTVTEPGYKETMGLIDAFRAPSVDLDLKPILYDVTLNFIDPQLAPPNSKVDNVTILVRDWDGVPVGKSIVVSSGEALRLPWGNYTLMITREYYNTSILKLSVHGNVTVTIEMKAIQYRVALRLLSSGFKGVSGGIAGVKVIIAPQAPLRINQSTATTNSEGVAIFKLRAGSYKVLMLGIGLKEPVVIDSNLTVKGTLTVTYNVTPPLCSVDLNILDSEASLGISANITLTYEGPYGRGVIALSAPRGRVAVKMPFGYYAMTVTAKYYQSYSGRLNLTRPEGVKVSVKLKPLKAPLTLEIVDPDGHPVDGALVRLQYEMPSLSPPPLVSINGTVKPRGGVRVGLYKVYVEPPKNAPLKPVSTTLTVGLKGYSTRIVLPFKYYRVVIRLVDAKTGKLIPFPYKLNITRIGAARPPLVEYPRALLVKNGRANLTLPYGTYNVILKAVRQNYYVIPSKFTFTVDRDGEVVNITLNRRVYALTITVVNDKSEPLPDALVELIDLTTHKIIASQLTSSEGTASFKAAYGVYEVVVEHKAYKKGVTYVSVPAQRTLTITLYPTPLTVLRRMTPLLVGVIGLIALAAVLWRIRGVISARLAEQEEYF